MSKRLVTVKRGSDLDVRVLVVVEVDGFALLGDVGRVGLQRLGALVVRNLVDLDLLQGVRVELGDVLGIDRLAHPTHASGPTYCPSPVWTAISRRMSSASSAR